MRAASAAAGSARYGSTPFSHRFEPSVRRASRSEVSRTPIGSKFAASSSTSVVVSPTSRVEPAHDRRERHCTFAVGDEKVTRVEPAQGAVEGANLLALGRVPHDDRPLVETTSIEDVEGASVHLHHVVRDVDDVRDRAHPGEAETGPQPGG